MTVTSRVGPEQREVLTHLGAGAQLTRSQLAELTNRSRNTIATRLDELIAMGWVEELETARSGGRPATAYALKRTTAVVFVAAFGSLHATWGVVDLLGEVLAEGEEAFDIADGPYAAIDRARAALARLCQKARISERIIQCVIVGLPSPIQPLTQRSINPFKMPGWPDFDVREGFAAAFGRPIAVENDAKLMVLGSWLSDYPDTQNLVFVKVASGVGAGIIAGGVLQQGALGMAGEIGHIPVRNGDRSCECGNVGCVVRYASIDAVIESLHAAGVTARSLDDIVRLAADGNSECARALRQAGRHLGEVAAVIVSITNPEVLVLGGTLASLGDDLLAGVRESLYTYAQPAVTSRLKTVVNVSHDRAALRGAAAVALDLLMDQDVRWSG